VKKRNAQTNSIGGETSLIEEIAPPKSEEEAFDGDDHK
jgi:hypothetical protein